MPAKTSPDLSAEVARLQAELDAAKAATGGLLPLVLHVGGAAHRGTARLVIRCEPAGAYVDRWMARVGEQLIGQDGSRLQARPFAQIRAALQERVAWPDLASAIKAAQTAALEG